MTFTFTTTSRMQFTYALPGDYKNLVNREDVLERIR